MKVVLAEQQKTNKWLAEKLGKDVTTVSKWCTNRSQPGLETKDCFGLHSHSAFGSIAKEESGVGQQSLLSQVQFTDMNHWLRADKTVDISRYASEISRLAFRLPHCLGCF